MLLKALNFEVPKSKRFVWLKQSSFNEARLKHAFLAFLLEEAKGMLRCAFFPPKKNMNH